uniref:Uncharacterized protein n=1 Tax=Oscillatoriales cyanobacterium SpSt-402 TaxID=2282168 RepID=A0A832H0F4_9CYAN
MVLRNLAGSFSGSERDVWAWFIPMFLPTLTLMIGAYSSIAFKEQTDSITVDKPFFYISLSCSAFYLTILLSVILYQPFADQPALEFFAQSSLFLSAIQGIATGCMGVFFVSQKQR